MNVICTYTLTYTHFSFLLNIKEILNEEKTYKLINFNDHHIHQHIIL